MKGCKRENADNQPRWTRPGKIPKNASPKRARTAGKGKRGAALGKLGNMTVPGCSRSFAGR
jgi:hypothetical protein